MEQRNLSRLTLLCEQRGISTTGVLAISIQRNKTTGICTLAVDFGGSGAPRLLTHYPAERLEGSRRLSIPPFIVTYKDGLPPPPTTAPEETAIASRGRPFCCSSVYPYMPRRLEREILFEDFERKHGSHPDYVYEVKEQVNNGALLSTRHFALVNGALRELPETAGGLHKVHAFKNYKCDAHNRFFGVDLYRRTAGANRHPVRLVPFTRVNQMVLDAFFEAAGV